MFIGCIKCIDTLFRKLDKQASKGRTSHTIPNVIDWYSNPESDNKVQHKHNETNSKSNKHATKHINTSNTLNAPPVKDHDSEYQGTLTSLGHISPKPQRQNQRPSKKRRINSSKSCSDDDQSHNLNPTGTGTIQHDKTTANNDAVNDQNGKHEPPIIINQDDRGAAGYTQTRSHNQTMLSGDNTTQTTTTSSTHNTIDDHNPGHIRNHDAKISNECNSISNPSNVTFQDEQDTFLPMRPDAVPFYRRSRGCSCAEAKAQERATGLENLADAGKPPRWAYHLSPFPAYVGPVAKALVDIQHRHALEITREVTRALRESGRSAATQAQLNWRTVAQSYGDDTNSSERAENRLASMASKEREKERSRVTTRNEFHLSNPIKEEDIAKHLSGVMVPIPAPARRARPNPTSQNRVRNNGPNQQASGGQDGRQQPQDNNGGNTDPPNRREQNNARRERRPNLGPANQSRSRSPRYRQQPNSNNGSRGRRQERGPPNTNRRGGYNNTRGNYGNDRSFNARQWGRQNQNGYGNGDRAPSNNNRNDLTEVIARVVAEFDRQRNAHNNQ